MDKVRIGLVCSQKKGQVVFVVVVDGSHLTAPWMDKTGRDKRQRRVGWECNISVVLFSPCLSPRLDWPLLIVDIELTTAHADSIGQSHPRP